MSKDCRYKKQIGLLLDKIDGKYYAVADYHVFELNEVGARILDLCNGENDIPSISKKLARFYNQDAKTMTDDVSAYISELLSNNLIKKMPT